MATETRRTRSRSPPARSYRDVELRAGPRAVDRRELHRLDDPAHAVEQPAALLAVDPQPGHLARRAVDDDRQVRRAAAVAGEAAAELAAVARVGVVDLVHAEGLAALVVVLVAAEIERL